MQRDSDQGCQFGFFEAKFVIFGLFSTPLAFLYLWKKANWNLAFFGLFWRIRFFMLADVDSKHTTSKTFRKRYAMCIQYQILNVASAQEWDFTAQMLWWFCAAANLKGNTGHQSLRDLITTITTVNLNRKLSCSSSQKKIKIFQRHVLSNTFSPFPNVSMRTTVFREEAIADHKVEEY